MLNNAPKEVNRQGNQGNEFQSIVELIVCFSNIRTLNPKGFLLQHSKYTDIGDKLLLNYFLFTEFNCILVPLILQIYKKDYGETF